MDEPKFRLGQMLRNTHSWAKEIPPYPVESVIWDEPWHCWTYGFPGVCIRIEEYMLEPADDLDVINADACRRYPDAQDDGIDFKPLEHVR